MENIGKYVKIEPKSKNPTLPKSKNKVGSLIVPNIFYKLNYSSKHKDI